MIMFITVVSCFFLRILRPPRSTRTDTLFPYTTLFRSVEVGDRGIVARGPLGGAIAWPDLEDLRLRYYSTRRDRTQGWMHMTLKSGGRTLTLESTISGFDDIAEPASEAARGNGLKLHDATLENLVALGGCDPRSEGRHVGTEGERPLK